jgi:hypothetical protein
MSATVAVCSVLAVLVPAIWGILQWWKNPKRMLEAKIYSLNAKWKDLQGQINAPLAKHDTNTLTRLNNELLEVLRQRKEAIDKLAALNGGTVIKVMALAFIVVGLTGCYKTMYFNESDKVICDSAGKGVCANMGYDCCIMGNGNFKSLSALNPTIKIIKVQDNTKDSD